MKYLEDTRLTELTSDLTEAFLNTRGGGGGGSSSSGGCGAGAKSSPRRGRGGRGRSTNTRKKGAPSNPASGNGAGGKQSGGAGRGGRGGTVSPKGGSSTSSGGELSYLYNPAGYSSYGSDQRISDATYTKSCRVVYGRVEAYTTKRAGSDKKTAHEVGERYAHEMERLNNAVNDIKKKHRLEAEKEKVEEAKDGTKEGEIIEVEKTSAAGSKNDASSETKDDQHISCIALEGKKARTKGMHGKPLKLRRRSQSLDGVTFVPVPDDTTELSGSSPILTTGKFVGTVPIISEDFEETPVVVGKRHMSLEGILKPPSKRCRATSFDISTGPSIDYRPLAIQGIGEFIRSEGEEPGHPLMPQPSLYQSSLGEYSSFGHRDLPTMAPRRLVTDLILTLNASFPDYDFSDARPSDFITLSIPEAMRSINEKLGEYAATTDRGRDFLPRLWNSLDDIVFGLKDAEVYSYAPKGDSGDEDPLSFLTCTLAGANDVVPSGTGTGAEDGGSNFDDDRISGYKFFPNGSGGEVGLVTGGPTGTTGALDSPTRMPSPTSDSVPACVTLWNLNYFFVSRDKKRIVLLTCVQTMRSPQGNEDDDYAENEEDGYSENHLVFDEARRVKDNVGVDRNMVDEEEELRAFSADTDAEEGDCDNEFDMDDETGPGTLGMSVRPPSPPLAMA